MSMKRKGGLMDATFERVSVMALRLGVETR